MKRFFVIANIEKAFASETAIKIRNYLSACSGVSCNVWLGGKSDDYPIPEDTECIITIGGDGTLIQAVRAAKGRNIKFIGINRGHLGYLTGLSGDEEIEPALKRLLEDDYGVEDRMMLKSHAYRNGKLIYEDIAINEVLVVKKDPLHIVRFDISVGGTFIGSFNGDGVIVSTPTGSSAYSLSAGGPIADPNSRLIILTPICSHSSNARSIIFGPNDRITVTARSDIQLLSCDSDTVAEIQSGDEIVIEESEYRTRFIKLKNESFMDVLREKMKLM